MEKINYVSPEKLGGTVEKIRQDVDEKIGAKTSTDHTLKRYTPEGSDTEVLGVDTENTELFLNETDQNLIKQSILGLVDKQDSLQRTDGEGNYLIPLASYLTSTDLIPIIQDGVVKLAYAPTFTDYLIANSPLPSIGLTLDEYSKADLYNIFNLGEGENYFGIGDRMTYMAQDLVTTCQIADFNFDIINIETGQAANVSFVVNDYAEATETEVKTVFDSAKATFVANSLLCLSPVVEFQPGGSLYERCIPDNLKSLLAPFYRMGGSPGWATEINHVAELVTVHPLSSTAFYPASDRSDIYTGEDRNRAYSLFSSTAGNLNMFTYKTPISILLILSFQSTTTGLRYLSDGGVATQTTSPVATATNGYIRRIPFGFCMGRGRTS